MFILPCPNNWNSYVTCISKYSIHKTTNWREIQFVTPITRFTTRFMIPKQQLGDTRQAITAAYSRVNKYILYNKSKWYTPTWVRRLCGFMEECMNANYNKFIYRTNHNITLLVNFRNLHLLSGKQSARSRFKWGCHLRPNND